MTGILQMQSTSIAVGQVDIHSPEMHIIDFETVHKLCTESVRGDECFGEYCTDDSCRD